MTFMSGVLAEGLLKPDTSFRNVLQNIFTTHDNDIVIPGREKLNEFKKIFQFYLTKKIIKWNI